MRVRSILVASLLASVVSGSWFSSSSTTDPDWSDWDATKLSAYLKEHGVPVPSGYTREQLAELAKANYAASASWTQDQLTSAQKVFGDIQESTIDTWNESQLRQFLVEHNIVAPSSTKEHLQVLAKQRYRAYSSALSSFSSAASTAVSTAIHGDATHQASKSLTSGASVASKSATSAASAASATASQIMDDTKDYVYSTWTDSELREYLEKKGYVKTKAELRRDELLAKMKDAYAAVTDPVYNAWSTSYMHDWLVKEGVIKSDYEANRDKLLGKMKDNYYDATQTVYSTWSDSTLKAWLVEHDVIKSDAEVKREKMLKLMSDHYHRAADTVWASWKDSDMRDWLIDNGYMRSDAQVKRDELIKMMNDKYNDASARTAAYLTWPDARLRAYLRSHGVDDKYVPTSRPDLLHEVRIRYVQTTSTLESLLASIRGVVSSGVDAAEEQVDKLKELLGMGKASAEKELRREKKAALSMAEKGAASASSAASSLSAAASAKKTEL